MRARRAAWAAWICKIGRAHIAGVNQFRDGRSISLTVTVRSARPRGGGPESRGARPPNPRNGLNPASAGFFFEEWTSWALRGNVLLRPSPFHEPSLGDAQ
jgi:hypothetical protein